MDDHLVGAAPHEEPGDGERHGCRDVRDNQVFVSREVQREAQLAEALDDDFVARPVLQVFREVTAIELVVEADEDNDRERRVGGESDSGGKQRPATKHKRPVGRFVGGRAEGSNWCHPGLHEFSRGPGSGLPGAML